ncbi:MAG TPA: DNA replication/repair protein RecF [Methylomirabilota bacterium]|nr:DNA replication/repair protein RecF [Methylomirabilota bacterium]
MRTLKLATQQTVLPVPPPPAIGAAAGAAVWLARLALTDFRNYARAEIAVDRRPVVLTGPNGAGKTNLLEAISFLVPGRGLRQARLGDADRIVPVAVDAGRRAWGVAATVQGPDGTVDVGTGRDPAPAADPGRERRLVKVNGALVAGPAALADVLGVIWLTPLMDRLFLDGASARRRFLDRLVFGVDPEHARRLARYEHVLQERSQLLRQSGVAGGDAAWLAALEQQIAEGGIAIAAARRELVARLDQAVAGGVGPFPRAALALDGAVEAWLAAMPALAAEDAFRRRLADDRARDAETGGAQCGPHRSDLRVTHLAKGMPAAACSTGEQKALLISIVLAQARLQAENAGRAPVLLLDEVAAHLDASRRSALFDEILALEAQAWLTGTDAALFADLAARAQFFRVREATIVRTNP